MQLIHGNPAFGSMASIRVLIQKWYDNNATGVPLLLQVLAEVIILVYDISFNVHQTKDLLDVAT